MILLNPEDGAGCMKKMVRGKVGVTGSGPDGDAGVYIDLGALAMPNTDSAPSAQQMSWLPLCLESMRVSTVP